MVAPRSLSGSRRRLPSPLRIKTPEWSYCRALGAVQHAAKGTWTWCPQLCWRGDRLATMTRWKAL